jgi:hypothetical protein
MTQQLPYASSFILNSAIIYQVGTDKAIDITNMVIKFDYFENINYPTVSATLGLVDNGANLIASLPIQGFEKIKLELKTSEDKVYTYEFRVYKVLNRFAGDRFQTYTLGLISLEALLNEGVRVAKTLKGKPDKIVKDLLKVNLNTTKNVTVDPCLYNIIFNPGKKSPFSIIESIKMKSVPQGSANKSNAKSSLPDKTNSSKTTVVSSTAETNKGEYSKVSGTAGYFFYENKDGFHFKSIDSLCSIDKFNGTSPVAKYIQENASVGGSPSRKIIDIDFIDEIDIMGKLRMGAFSSLICYYNFSTGTYEEYTYSLSDSYQNMGHMGTQKGLPSGQAELSKYPTRIMSVMLDHETWFNGETIASPEEKDGGNSSTTSFPDFQKNYISQSISRLNTLQNQKVKITITGNPDLKIGDKIEIEIPNQIPTSQRKEQKYDEEHSGVYLIAELNHAFDSKKRQMNTFLTLIRDSYGKRDTGSKVK